MAVACGGAALALLARDPRLRYGAALAALIAAPVLVGGDVWHSARFVHLRHHPVTLAAAIAVTLAAVGAGAVMFRRYPWTLPVSLFAALPLRVPVQVAGQTAHLLIPLYAVIAAGSVCVAYAALADERASGADGRPRAGASLADWPPAVWLYRILAATLVLYAIQTAYTADVSNAIENACFFLVPFAVMFVLLGEVRWTERLLAGV